MEKKKNKLRKEDEVLFAALKGNYVSENEKNFFEKIRYKMEYEDAPSNDLLMFEEDNDDHIYIVRCYYEEFIIGHGLKGKYDEEFHVMTLSEALNANLMRLGFINHDITLLEWLREHDYERMRYNHNYALM